MNAFSMIRPTRAAGLLTLLALCAAPIHAQGLPGLIKKKLEKPTTPPPGANQPVVFDAVTLEITPERVQKLTEARRAVRKLAEAPDGPAALQKQIEIADTRQAAIYAKQVDNINKWDEKRRDYERCVDSVLVTIHERKNTQAQSQMLSDPAKVQKMMQLGQALAAAQQKGDTAAMRKITEQLGITKAVLTKADSAEAAKHCVYPTPSAVIKEWLDLKQQIESLTNQKQDAEVQMAKTEETVSGMNARQSAIFCERIKQYVKQLKEKVKNFVGFSDDELKRLENMKQAIEDLEALCP